MTANDCYKLILYIIKKSQSASFSPDDFNRTINAAQLSYTNFLLGEFQQYQYGRAVARVEFGQNAIIRERLAPFISIHSALTLDSNGDASYPGDYLAFDAMYYGSDFKSVRETQQDKLSNVLNSDIDPIAENPCFIIVDTGFRFYPPTIQPYLSYVRKPRTITYAYTLDADGRPVYNAGGSVDPLWKDLDMMQIIVRALAMVGVNLQAGMVEQYSQVIKNQGQ
jgi:hypothetical protein